MAFVLFLPSHTASAHPRWLPGPCRTPMNRERLFTLIAAALFFVPPSAAAQTVLVRVLDDDTSQPVFGALAFVEGEGGVVVKSALTDERGRALLLGLDPGDYRVRVEMIGKAMGRTPSFSLAAEETVAHELRLMSSAIVLEGISVEAESGRCSVRPEQGMIISDVWEEARKALSAAAFTDDQEVYRYQTLSYVREIDRETRIVRSEQSDRSTRYRRTPFSSRPAEDLLENGFVQSDDQGDVYYAPDAAVLLSDPFLDTHCFRLAQGEDEAEGLIGLAFEPTGGRGRVPDIAGTLWIDPSSSELRWLDYRYQNLNAVLSAPEVGGRVDFRRMPNGTWIVPEWWIRMPMVGYVRDGSGRRQPFLEAFRVTGAQVTQVQEAGGRTLVEAESGTVQGIVLDSLGLEPMPGARVGIVGSNQSVFANAEGRFTISGLVEGVYEIGFTHPSLEMLGAPTQTVVQEVLRGEVTSLQFRIPSQGDVLFEACRGEERPEGTAVLLGWLRDAPSSQPLESGTVEVRWGRYTIQAQGTLDARLGPEMVEGFQVTTGTDGLFRFCAVPEDQLLTVTGAFEGRETVSDTLRIPALSGARVHIIDVPRARR